jgi:hypothetical protein
MALDFFSAKTGRRGRMGRKGGRRAYEKKGTNVSSSPPFVPFDANRPAMEESIRKIIDCGS